MSEIKILSKKEIDALLTKPTAAKEIIYGSTIEKLKSGEGFLVNIESFKETMKTPLQTYYANKYKKKGNDIIDIKKMGDSYLIRKK
ncbi:hypothetical protein [Flavobacterium ardleyense]|uniref:hypothetical protein n=1 Tax=Flavobacterium ardleyense TaxID=2038737 RepID=UPI00298CBAF5|nr:hypothetical protein [Flavobacterium ardleyense]